MPLSEFSLIQRYFADAAQRQDVSLGIGDDAAVLSIPKDYQLVMSLDTLVEGVHFPKNTSAKDIAYKALAVNLSDMAAMGAEPAWIMLGLTLPEVDEAWLDAFSSGLFELANEHGVSLIGGDTTRGPLTVSMQISGFAPEGQVLCRHGAKPGEKIYVTGQLGDAGLGLSLVLDQAPIEINALERDYLLRRLNRPTPRVAVGMALRCHASAAIDLSDGLISDLGHILNKSSVGAVIDVDRLPVVDGLKQLADWWRYPLTAGDDYELCFTVPEEHCAEVEHRLAELACPCVCIGEITEKQAMQLIYQGSMLDVQELKGYQHFE